MTLNDNLKKLMLRHGNLSVSDLAKATLLPQPTLYQLFSGATERPRQKTLRVLADYFSVSVSQFIGDEPLPDIFSKQLMNQLNILTTPILTWDDLYSWPDQLNFSTKKELILEAHSSGATFALEMIGSSMEPLFPAGCLLIFDANKVAKDRDCVIVYIKKSDQFSFKKLLLDGDAAYVKSINAELNDIQSVRIAADDVILATLLEARIKF